ncbi:proteasome complex subunit Rpn13 ubiquitin receptor-domain-containing protein [Syncephalis plumigaleata]|nr:proteasome complex subunit Rpn13 ubiquitin receptor-domain-containing protein [Syncephalis plumigaleata]
MATSLFPDLLSGGQSRLLEFKAGRLFRDGDTNWVRPDEAKGLIYLDKPDGLLHFYWKNRDTNNVAEDLIIFADDAEFFKVTQSSGRVYALKFKSSGNIMFFWMQHADEERDEMLCQRLNDLIANPDAADMMDDRDALMQMLNSSMDYNIDEEDTGEHQEPLLSEVAAPTPASAGAEVNLQTNQLSSLRELLANITVPDEAEEQSTDAALSLGDVLTVKNIQPLLNDSELCSAVFPHLPEGAPQTADEVKAVVGSPQFRQSLASLSAALNTGQLGPLVQELGLPPSAGHGVEAFLQAIETCARQRATENEEEMQADPTPSNQDHHASDQMEE